MTTLRAPFGCMALILLAAAPAAAEGRAAPAPFVTILSNTAPLAFGMTAEETARALGAPLIHLRGRLGEETFLALRPDGGSGFFFRDDRLYLQFRRGRLTGWKGDWRTAATWR